MNVVPCFHTFIAKTNALKIHFCFGIIAGYDFILLHTYSSEIQPTNIQYVQLLNVHMCVHLCMYMYLGYPKSAGRV